jgi:serine/threonine protein kinase
MNIERFDIIKILGKGRTGGVYEALDTYTNHRVALRRFFSVDGNTDSSYWEDSFIDLVDRLAKVKHPALMSIYSAGVDDDGAFMVMELLEKGRSIEKLVEKEKHLSNESFQVMACDLLNAFSVMHSMGYCHGSVSGRSVMEVPLANPNGNKIYKCVDLGMSSLIPMINPALPFLAVGDPALTAPELFEGQEADARSDVYMLGHLFYLSLAGGHPLAGIPADEAYKKHRKHRFAPLSGYRSSVSKDIVNWIEFLTQADPSRRPQSAGEALEALPLLYVIRQEELSPLSPQVRFNTQSAPAQHLNSAKLTPLKLPAKKQGYSAPLFVGLAGVVLAIVLVVVIASQSKKELDSGSNLANLESSSDSVTLRRPVIEQIPEQTATDSINTVPLNLTKPAQVDPLEPKGPSNESIQMKRITYQTPQLLISEKLLSEGGQIAEEIALDKAKAWHFIEAGSAHSSSEGALKIELDSVPLQATANVGVSVEKNGILFDKFQGLSFSSIPNVPRLRYTLQGCEGKVQARFYFKTQNLETSTGVSITGTSNLAEGVSLSPVTLLEGLCYMDIQIDESMKDERFGIDFNLLKILRASEPSSFIPIAFLIYDDFPIPPALKIKQGNESEVKVQLPPEEFPDGVKVTPNGDGTNTLELLQNP